MTNNWKGACIVYFPLTRRTQKALLGSVAHIIYCKWPNLSTGGSYFLWESNKRVYNRVTLKGHPESKSLLVTQKCWGDGMRLRAHIKMASEGASLAEGHYSTGGTLT